jgi:hypothetical protein
VATDAPNSPAACCDPYLVTLLERFGSTVTCQFLQHHDLDSSGAHRLGHILQRFQPHQLKCRQFDYSPPNYTDPSSIIVGNGTALPITSIEDTMLPDPFYLNNIPVAPDIIQKIYRFIVSQLTIGILWSLTPLAVLSRIFLCRM